MDVYGLWRRAVEEGNRGLFTERLRLPSNTSLTDFRVSERVREIDLKCTIDAFCCIFHYTWAG